MLEGQWTELKGKVRERWGKLTDDDLDRIAGKRGQLIGTIQQKYGEAREKAERQVSDFEAKLEHKHASAAGSTTH
jgi:uncharacterized protein YjbJ (UPF0337 family)